MFSIGEDKSTKAMSCAKTSNNNLFQNDQYSTTPRIEKISDKDA